MCWIVLPSCWFKLSLRGTCKTTKIGWYSHFPGPPQHFCWSAACLSKTDGVCPRVPLGFGLRSSWLQGPKVLVLRWVSAWRCAGDSLTQPGGGAEQRNQWQQMAAVCLAGWMFGLSLDWWFVWFVLFDWLDLWDLRDLFDLLVLLISFTEAVHPVSSLNRAYMKVPPLQWRHVADTCGTDTWLERRSRGHVYVFPRLLDYAWWTRCVWIIHWIEMNRDE
jgi:hypothetical protein